jgi:hypothetical protein
MANYIDTLAWHEYGTMVLLACDRGPGSLGVLRNLLNMSELFKMIEHILWPYQKT